MFTTVLGGMTAAATLVLAVATVLLARQGRKQVIGELRPVLVVGESSYDSAGGLPGVSINRGQLALTVQNIGRGAALDVGVTVELSPNGQLMRADPVMGRPMGVGGFVVFTWKHSPVAPGQASGWVEYQDVAENGYRTDFVLRLPNISGTLDVGRVLMQQPTPIPPFIPWWARRLPQPVRRRYASWKLHRSLADVRRARAARGPATSATGDVLGLTTNPDDEEMG